MFLVAFGLLRKVRYSAMKKSATKSLTKSPSQTEVVTFAVYSLGGASRAVDTEDVAIEAHQLAPGRFSWRKYPDQINLELVRVYLSDAKKVEKGELLIGSGRTGWRLTQKGLKWAKDVGQSMSMLDASRDRMQSRSGSIDEQRWRRERLRITSTTAWRLWESGERQIPLADSKEVFRIDSYAKGDLREAKLTRVRSMFIEDAALAPFLDHLIKTIGDEAAK
jgi:hypothetical protein